MEKLLLGSGLFRASINERLNDIEKRVTKNTSRTRCVIMEREFNILKEDIEESYAKGSKQMKRLNKFKNRICKI